MRIPRIYYFGPIALNDNILLDDSASNHVVKVLRLKPGHELRLFNGQLYEGQLGEFVATLKKIEKYKAMVRIVAFHPNNNESPLAIHLGQAISRGERMDYTLQKSVELGVKEITPLFTERCGVELEGERLTKKIQHWQNIVISACEQSGRTFIPQVKPALPLEEWLKSIQADLKLITDPKSPIHLNEINNEINSIALLCGPEGGLSEDEIVLSHRYEMQGLSLGPRILRTETAALTAISLLQHRWGDLRGRTGI
jgi:16S rRNA (uracil1498-N3)-methyltransferase